MNPISMKYRDIFNQTPGEAADKIRSILETYACTWRCAPQTDALIKDIVMDKSMTSDEMLDLLESLTGFEEDNIEFKNAYLAMKAAARKSRLSARQSAPAGDLLEGYEQAAANMAQNFKGQFPRFAAGAY